MSDYGNRRPQYETKSDRDNEERVRSMLRRIYATSEIGKCPAGHAFDTTIRIDGKEGWIEIKTRPEIKPDKYPTYMISKTKWETGKVAIKEKLITTFMIAVHYPLYHQLLIYTYKPEDEGSNENGGEQIYEAMGGREDRNDPADKEPCIFIPIWMFEVQKI